MENMEFMIYGSSVLFLVILGYVSAKAGGAKPIKPILRLVLWGTLAMGITILVGNYFGVEV